MSPTVLTSVASAICNTRIVLPKREQEFVCIDTWSTQQHGAGDQLWSSYVRITVLTPLQLLISLRVHSPECIEVFRQVLQLSHSRFLALDATYAQKATSH